MAEKSLEERIQRLEDIHEIQNLMSRYVYLHTAGRHQETADLFAQKTPGVKGVFPSWGIYEGNKSIERVFVGVHTFQDGDRKGIMRMHTLTTPLIEVAGDGQTAKGAWISPGHETMKDAEGKARAYWAWMKYGSDFVKEEGRWRFWHVHIYGLFLTPYEVSWAEPREHAIPIIPEELLGDKPIGTFWEYSPDAIYPDDEPFPPEPYEVWKDSLSY